MYRLRKICLWISVTRKLQLTPHQHRSRLLGLMWVAVFWRLPFRSEHRSLATSAPGSLPAIRVHPRIFCSQPVLTLCSRYGVTPSTAMPEAACSRIELDPAGSECHKYAFTA